MSKTRNTMIRQRRCPMHVLAITALVLLSSVRVCAADPTWTNGVACIVYSHCTPCHNDKGIAPFPLTTYEQNYQRRAAIAAAVQSRSMPPYPASQDKRRYAHANTLSRQEIDGIIGWVNNDAPLGDANNIPPAPVYSTSYQITNPDFVGTIPTYTVTSDKDTYRMFVIPMNNAEQKMITRIEVVPGNRSIVHHALIFVDTSRVPLDLDLKDPLPGYAAFGGTGSSSSRLVTGYTPGQQAFTYAPGFGSAVLTSSYLVIQMHYPGGVRGESDSTQVRIQYGAPTLRPVSTVPALNHNTTLINGPLFIPANTVKTFYSRVTNAANRTLTGVMPHMHLLGRSIRAICVTPKGDTIDLIDIKDWDFHWQYFYQFQKPVFIPAGSVVYGEAVYDNTTANHHNPNDPPKDVSKGEGTEDEMMLIYMNLSDYKAGDTNIVIDTSSHYAHDSSCELIADRRETEGDGVMIDMDGRDHSITVRGIDGTYGLRVFNYNGAVVFDTEASANEVVSLSALSRGVYYLQLRLPSNTFTYKKYVRE